MMSVATATVKCLKATRKFEQAEKIFFDALYEREQAEKEYAVAVDKHPVCEDTLQS